MKYFLVLLLGLLAATMYLCWPTGMDPVAWTPPQVPALEGRYAYNETLKGIQRIAENLGAGPVAVNVDATNQVYAGYSDGRIIRMEGDASSYTEMARADDRPLGITFGPNGGIVVAATGAGLMHIGNELRPLTAEAGGAPIRYANDVDNSRLDANLYFTDSSSKFGPRRRATDLLEHGANGRLLSYNADSKETHVLLTGLHFPTGVAVGPDDTYLLVCEAGEYRILRYWLKGPAAGTREVFIDKLPGFPDHISFNDFDKFWLALAAPRSAALDRLLPGAFFLRRILGRLPEFLLPYERSHALVLGLNLNGKVVANLQYAGADAYAPVTSVREHGPWLYFGSSRQSSIGRLPLDQAVPGASPPPPGWEQLPKLEKSTASPARETDED